MANRQLQTRIAAVCVIVLALAACVVCAWPWAQFLNSLTFERTACVIKSSSIETVSPGTQKRSASYTINVCYEYEWQGKRFQSDQYDIRFGPSSVTDDKLQAVRALKEGDKSFCWVDPRDPSRAVMDRGLTGSHAILILPAAFLVGGCLALRLGTKAAGRASAGPDKPSAVS